MGVGFRRDAESRNGLTEDRLAFGWSCDAGEAESVPSVGGDARCFSGGIGEQEGVAAMERAENAIVRFDGVDQGPGQGGAAPSGDEAMRTDGVDIRAQTCLVV